MLLEFDQQVFKQAVQSLTLLAWAVHSDNGPLLTFIIKKRGKGWYGDTTQDSLSDDEKKWDALLNEYEFRMADEFDLALLDGIRVGFFDEDKLRKAGAILDKTIKTLAGQDTLEKAWRLYHDTFDPNEDALMAAIAESFERQVELVTPLNLDGTVRLLKDLGHPDAALAALEYYMENRNEDKGFFDLSESPFGEHVKDDDVKEAFATKLATFKDERSPVDVLTRIGKDHDWGRADIDLLWALSVDDFHRLFKSQEGTDLTRVINASLGFGRIVNADEKMKEIAARAEEALMKIGKESRLNRRRVEKYGIKFKDE